MKHAGSREELLGSAAAKATVKPTRFSTITSVGAQSRASLLTGFVCALLLVAVIADAGVRDLSRSLDPSLTALLRIVTQFGNSAWPLGIGLALLGCATFLERRPGRFAPDQLQDLRSVLLLMIGSVAISGTLASLAKNILGRVRPSTAPDAQVLDFTPLSFDPGWASFPSGHATTATACALALAISFPRHSWAWLSFGLLASLSRAFLGVHWLTDCLAGSALGTVTTLWLRSLLQHRGHRLQIETTVPFSVAAAAIAEGLRSAYSFAARGLARPRASARRRSGRKSLNR